MRFLFLVADKFPPHRVDVSVLFGKYMPRHGWQIDWIAQAAEPRQGGKTVAYGKGRAYVGRTVAGNSLICRLLRHILRYLNAARVLSIGIRGGYSFIQAKDLFLSAMMALIAARVARVPFFYWLSYPFPEAYLLGARERTVKYPRLYWIRGLLTRSLLYRLLLRCADHIFVQSEQMARDISEHGIERRRMTVVPMGIDWEEVSDLRRVPQKSKPSGERWVVYCGVLLRVRRLDILVRVLPYLRERCGDVHLYFVGSGRHPGDESTLLQVADSLGVRQFVHITGEVTRAEVLSYIRAADVAVSPYYPTQILLSTSPTKLIEYLAVGAPVVATEHPEQSKVISECGSGLCVPWDEVALRDAIAATLLRSKRARINPGEGRKFVRFRRSYDRIAEELHLTYMELLSGRKRGGVSWGCKKGTGGAA